MEQRKRIDKVVINQIISDSAIRVRNVLLALGFMQLLQLIVYLIGKNNTYKDTRLIMLKFTMVSFVIVCFFILNLLDKGQPFLYKNGEAVITLIVLIALVWSVFNTFVAQSITSDISIYILVLFTITAVARIRLWIIIIIYSIGYIIFFIGMPYFQSNPAYLTSHIMNGLILTIVALLISLMLFRYAISDYFVKQDINRKNKELLFLAQRDGLTSLYNHKTIHELLEKILLSNQFVKKNEDLSAVCLLLLDLDNFKAINDRFGHKFGDNILKKTSEAITLIMDGKNIIGRYGGDEFMVIMPEIHINEAKVLAEELLDEVALIKIEDFEMTFSCGIAVWEGESSDKLVEKADQLMYISKNKGRNMVTVNH